MAEKNKTTPPKNIPPPPPQSQKQINVALSQAINNLNQRMSIIEIQTSKANANVDILNKTIELIEKRMNFNEKKNESEKN